MVFGFGFNKAKVLASAEKNVKQGKLHNAIADYEKILKEDPKDLTVMNTVGDLCARVGNSEKATEYFRKVGDVYAADGFTVKAIAMYKKLTKQDPNALDVIQKLAELYTQQGLYNDARAQYMQVAECSLRNNETQNAARLFQKMLELDPENVNLQTRLAELLAKLSRTAEARDLYFRIAESFRSRGSLDLADEALGHVLKLDPNFSQAVLIRAVVKLDSGDPKGTVQLLQQLPDIDSRADGMSTLLKALLELGNLADAEPVARKLLRVSNDPSGIIAYADTLIAGGNCEQALKFYQEHADRLLATNMPKVIEVLQASIARVKSSPAALEMLAELFQRAGNTIYTVEVTELLAHAYVQDGQLTRAADLYQKLTTLEPENPAHAHNCRQIALRMGHDGAAVNTPLDEGPKTFAVEEIESVSALKQEYPDEIADVINAALTDAELFESYNLPAKAIPPLERALRKAPRDARVNHRLASLYARSGRLREAADRCLVLRQLYVEAGLFNDSNQFSELAAKFRERSGEAQTTLPAATAAAQPVISATPAPASAPPTAKPSVDDEQPIKAQSSATAPDASSPGVTATSHPAASHEFDLSDEWDQMLEVEAPPAVVPPPAPPVAPMAQPVRAEAEPSVGMWDSFEDEAGPGPDAAIADALDEIRFYMSQSMWTEARSALAHAESISPGSAELATLKLQLADGDTGATTTEVADEEVELLTYSESSSPAVDEQDSDHAQPAAASSGDHPIPPPAFAPPESPLTMQASAAPAVVESPSPVRQSSSDDLLGSLVLHLEDSLGDGFAVAEPPRSPAPSIAPAQIVVPSLSQSEGSAPPIAVASTQPAAAAAPAIALEVAPPAPAPAPVEEEERPGALSDIFAEFKESMEAGSDSQEDPETHYNLGLAFKEMGLLDEAIGELQKVCQAIERGRPFPQAIQAYTWLADCFLHQGVPEAAVRWYEKALHSRQIDGETATAIHYELACAQEATGNRPAALSHFMEVYGTNIDYRDVAERIKALKS